MAQKYPAIGEPIAEINSVRTVAAQLKEGFEILSSQRGDRASAAVTWQDLVDLGLILPSQIPTTPSSR